MGIGEEVDSFINQTIQKYEKNGIKIRDSYWENYIIKSLRDLYLQLKFICENLERAYIKEYEPDFERGLLIYRIGNTFLKFALKPWRSIGEFKERPMFVWQEYETELQIDEYVDIIMSLTGSMFEYYYSLTKNNILFNCTEIAKGLSIDSNIISEISKYYNLRKVYDKLSSETTSRYGIETSSLFPKKFVEVRNAVAHMDYSYEKLGKKRNVKIILNEDKTSEIKLDELIDLIHRIVSLVNTIKIISYYFASPKSTLPL